MDYRGLDVIKNELDRMEAFIEENVLSSQALISSAVSDLVRAGGKRIRPAIAILSGKAVGQRINKLIPIAASMEIIHMATLVHDDIVDDSELRRGMPTVQSRYGKDVAVFTGDYLFSKAFMVISQYADRSSLKGFAHAVKRICEGEIEQYQSRYSLDVSLLKYLRRIKRKTGMLMALSCVAGAAGKNVNQKLIRKLGAYGMYLGMAFQITDDILDFTGDQKKVGKPVGNDVRQGVYTLPLIYALEHSNNKEELHNILKKCKYDNDDIARIVEIVRQSGGIEYSKSLADRFVIKGKRCLDGLKDSVYKEALSNLITDLNQRQH